jgi:hypothetical protein
MDSHGKMSGVELLSRATQALRDSAGLTAITKALEKPLPDRNRCDALLQIGFPANQSEYCAVIKSYITNDIIGAIANEIRGQSPRGILVTSYVTKSQADKLKTLGLQFFDTAGNAYLNELPLYVFVSGRPASQEETRPRATRAFTSSGLKTTFALLNKPGLEKESYREIAGQAGVSHATIGWVMEDLEEEGFLIDMQTRGRRLANKEGLLRRWIEAYPEQLRPKLLIARYRSTEPDWWTNLTPGEPDFYWGGEVAAAKLTNYLRPERVTIYAAGKLPALQVKWRWRNDAAGNVELLKKFWNFEYEDERLAIVPPLLVYADLVASADDRNLELARMIYDTHISRLIG